MPQQFRHSIGSPRHISLDHACNLLSITTVQDSLGQFIKTEIPTTVFCSLQSVTRSEFAASGQLGFKPDKLFVVDSESYDQEQFLEFDSVKYSIYRTFMRGDGFTELYCTVKSGD
jgi:hypothetical protein